MEQSNERLKTGELVLLCCDSDAYKWPCFFVRYMKDDYVLLEDLFGESPNT